MTVLSVPVRLQQIGVTGARSRWEQLGFTVSDNGFIAFENGALAFDGSDDATGLIGVAVDSLPGGVESASVDGIEVIVADAVPPMQHPNGAFELDHLVIVTPDLAATSRHLDAVLGLRQLRVRPEQRQAFHRFGDVVRSDGSTARGCIVEVVENDEANSAHLWGVVVNTTELERAAADYEQIGEPKDAVQPGRRIATVRSAAGLGVGVALMSPHVSTADGGDDGDEEDGRFRSSGRYQQPRAD